MSRAIYKSLLALPNPSPLVQQRSYEYGLRTKDWDLLALLGGIDGLIPEIDEAMGQIPAAKVLAVWVSRPGRDRSALLDRVRREDRVTVQSAYAALRGMSDDMYIELVECLDRAAAQLTFVENPDVPTEARAIAAAKLGPVSHRLKRRDAARLTSVAEAYPEMHDTLAATSTSVPLLTRVGGSPEIGEASLKRIVRFIDDSLKTSHATYGVNPRDWRISSAVSELVRLASAIGVSPAMSAETLAELIQVVTDARAREAAGGSSTNQYDNALRTLQNVASTPPPAMSVADARSSDDPDAIEAAVQWALTNASRLMASALAQNTRLSASQLGRLLHLISWQSHKMLIDQNIGDLDKVVVMLMYRPHMFDDRLLRKTGDPAAALTKLVHALVSQGRRIPEAVAASAYMTPEIARQCPPVFFTTDGTPAAMTEVMAEVLERELGDHDVAWLMCESMWDTFTGTLDELLTVVRATHPEIAEAAKADATA